MDNFDESLWAPIQEVINRVAATVSEPTPPLPDELGETIAQHVRRMAEALRERELRELIEMTSVREPRGVWDAQPYAPYNSIPLEDLNERLRSTHRLLEENLRMGGPEFRNEQYRNQMSHITEVMNAQVPSQSRGHWGPPPSSGGQLTFRGCTIVVEPACPRGSAYVMRQVIPVLRRGYGVSSGSYEDIFSPMSRTMTESVDIRANAIHVPPSGGIHWVGALEGLIDRVRSEVRRRDVNFQIVMSPGDFSLLLEEVQMREAPPRAVRPPETKVFDEQMDVALTQFAQGLAG